MILVLLFAYLILFLDFVFVFKTKKNIYTIHYQGIVWLLIDLYKKEPTFWFKIIKSR